MSNISTTLCADNHVVICEDIEKQFSGKKFNLLVKTSKQGDLSPKVMKFCGRFWSGEAKINGGQISIPMTPGGSIAWDLNVEDVVVGFQADGSVWIQRFIKNTRKYKVMLLTVNPI